MRLEFIKRITDENDVTANYNEYIESRNNIKYLSKEVCEEDNIDTEESLPELLPRDIRKIYLESDSYTNLINKKKNKPLIKKNLKNNKKSKDDNS